MNSKYLKDSEWVKKYETELLKVQVECSEPKFVEITNGYILPTKASENLSWGLGGVLDDSKKYIPDSGVPKAFGGEYPFEEPEYIIEDDIVFIGIIPKQIGHFLIDAVCRYWYLIENNNSNHKIAYCSYYWDSNPLDGKYGELFDLLNIDRSRMMHITQPIKCKHIIIPQATMSFGGKCNIKYKWIIDTLIYSVLNKPEFEKRQNFEKIYFNKRFYFPANIKQVGEKEIEELFKENGFSIISPEKLSLSEMIYYISNCKVMASLSGTTSHYAMFSKKDFKLLSLNRLPEPLRPQFRIDAIFNIDNTYIDCYNKSMLKAGNEYGSGVIWVEITDELNEYLRDNNYRFSRRKKTVSLKNQCEYLIKNIIYKMIPVVKRILGR